jgi:hypothetical protein
VSWQGLDVLLHFFDEIGGEAPTDYILIKKNNQLQHTKSRNKKRKVKNKKDYT